MVVVTANGDIPWLRITALAISQVVSWGVLYYAFAVIAEPMGLETGWTRPEMHGAQSLGLFICGLGALTVGRHIDRGGGRGLMSTGAILGCIAVILWSRCTALWQLYATFALIGISASMTLYEAAFAVAAKMVPGSYRKAIVAITLLGGLASTVFIPLTHWLVELIGWRNGLLVLAATVLVVCTAIPWFLLRGDVAGVRELTRCDAATRPLWPTVRRKPIFWLLLASYVSFTFFYSSLLFSLLPMFASFGFTSVDAVTLYAMIGPAQVMGRLAVFYLDKALRTDLAGFVATVLPVLAMAILISPFVGSNIAYLFPVLFGAGMGIKTVVQATAGPEFLGIAEYGTLQGLFAMPVQLVQAIAPFVAASLWQWDNSYFALNVTLMALAVFSAITFGAAGLLSRRV